MDDKKLDELLHEMKDKYDHAPEFIEKHELIQQVEMGQKQPFWKRAMPSIAAVAGLLLFVVMTLTFLDSDTNQASNQTDEEEGPVSNEEDSENAEEIEELEAYFEEAKERFREDLGLERVDYFLEVQHLEGLIKQFKTGVIDFSASNIKQIIDQSLIIPRRLIEDIDQNPDQINDEDLNYLFGHFRTLGVSLQDAFSTLLVENKITEEKQHEILKLQEAVDQYNGPKEIVDFMNMLNEQGYYVEKNEEYLMVKIDYSYLSNYLEKWNASEGYSKFFEVISAINMPTESNPYGVEWTELDTVILELEDILNTYGDELDELTKEQIIMYAESYLSYYLTTHSGIREEVSKEVQQEFEYFLDNYPDSIYWSFIKKAYDRYLENEWNRNEYYGVSGELSILLSDAYGDIDAEDIVSINSWPIDDSTIDLYIEYKDNHDPAILEDLTAFETTSLFTYAYTRQHVDTYYTLLSENSRWADKDKEEIDDEFSRDTFFYTSKEATHIITQQIDERTVNHVFIQHWGVEKVLNTIQLVKEDGIWKVSDPFVV